MKKIFISILLVLFTNLFIYAGNNENFSLALSPAYYLDNNIFEKVESGQISDNFMQFSLNGKYQKALKTNRLKVNYFGNVQQYFQYDRENKIFNRFDFDFTRYLKRKKILFINGFFYHKNWFRMQKSYHNSHLSIGMLKRNQQTSFSFDVHGGKYYYSYFPEFNNRNIGIRAKLAFQKTNYLSYVLFFDANYFEFSENFIHKPRFDHHMLINFGFEYRRKLIFGVNFQGIHQQSNYDFLVSNSLVVAPYLSAEIFDVYFQILAKYNFKKYVNEINPNQISIIYPDPEANINNQVYLGVERKIWRHLEFKGQLVFFSSEYRYQADFYEKLLIGVGVKYGL